MEIIFALTGAECVTAPSRGIIYLDPTLDYESAVQAIQASLPGVHVDAIRHWVEKAMPSAVPLNRRALSRAAPRKSRVRRATAWLALLAVGAAGMWGASWVKREYLDNVFDGPVFAELARDRGWSCDRGLERPMSATCVTREGLTLRANATMSERMTAYTISYEVSGAAHMNRLVVFESSAYVRAWLSTENVTEIDGLHPNLVVGSNWVLYGNDSVCVRLWASVLPPASQG